MRPPAGIGVRVRRRSLLSAPVKLSDPVISGSGIVGTELSTTDGTWTGNPTITYQWFRGEFPLTGETANAYTVVEDDIGSNLYCRVKATNAAGFAYGYTTAVEGIGYDTNTVLLLPMTGANNSTTFTDISEGGVGSPHTLTPYADAKIITTQVDPFGQSDGVAFFDGTGDALTSDYSADWEFGGGNFTVECWLKTPSPVADWRYAVNFPYGPTLQNGWNVFNLRLSDTGKANWYAGASAGSYMSLTGSTDVDDGAWHHIAAVRNGTSWKLFVDGVEEASTTSSITQTDHTDGKLGIAADWYNGGFNNTPLQCYMSDLRISKSARYTGNFTPPGRLTPYV